MTLVNKDHVTRQRSATLYFLLLIYRWYLTCSDYRTSCILELADKITEAYAMPESEIDNDICLLV